MKVYVVNHRIDYEGENTLAVFSDNEKAEKFVSQFKTQGHCGAAVIYTFEMDIRETCNP